MAADIRPQRGLPPAVLADEKTAAPGHEQRLPELLLSPAKPVAVYVTAAGRATCCTLPATFP
ncbi:MAG: hypothetical protein U0992_02525 [Planctomycetaceae bacterium]